MSLTINITGNSTSFAGTVGKVDAAAAVQNISLHEPSVDRAQSTTAALYLYGITSTQHGFAFTNTARKT